MSTQRVLLSVFLILALLAPGESASVAQSSASTAAPAPAKAPAAPGDEYWAAGYNLPGTNGYVFALAIDPDDSLYVGGEFSTAGGILANNIARWDGSQWHPLASGMNGIVRALAVGLDGALYAGGSFTIAGGVAASAIARWDGTQWHPLGSGVGGDYASVWALAVGPDGSLYVGGVFTTAGGVAANNIARWDGSQWYPLGSGTDGQVFGLSIGTSGLLYAGGSITSAGGVSASSVAQWNGTVWQPLGSGMNEYSTVWSLAVGLDGSLYAGGNFTTAGGVAASKIARWVPSTSSWHPLDNGIGGLVDSSVRALTVASDGSLYAGGNFTTAGGTVASGVARWNGTAWQALGGGLGSFPDDTPYTHALATGPAGSIYVGGWFMKAGDVGASHIARWNQTTSSWHSIGLGNGTNHNPGVALSMTAGGSFYAGGGYVTAGNLVTNGIARWDHATASWHSVGGGMGGSAPWVQALASGPNGLLYAAGSFTEAGGVAALAIARWDGSAWQPLVGQINGSVGALAVASDGSLYAGGSFTAIDGVTANRIARWDGASWQPCGTGMSGSGVFTEVNTLLFGPDGSLFAGGTFTTAGAVTVNHIARWDGASWHALGSGVSGSYPRVDSLAFGPDDSLFVGGQFTTAGGIVANRIARWDGSQWYPIGAGVDIVAYALTVGPDGAVYLGGSAGSTPGVEPLVRWNGEEWQALGSGVTGLYSYVNDLKFGPDGSLYVVGNFTTAGGKPSADVAQWNGEAVRRCDFNESGEVDVGDIMIVAALWNQPAGPLYDLDGDGVITVVDITRTARWWDWPVP